MSKLDWREQPFFRRDFYLPSMVRSLSGQPHKSIQIQLTLKGRVLVLSKESRHDLSHESFRIMHHKGSSVGLPTYDIRHVFRLDSIQHRVQSKWERCNDTTSHGCQQQRDGWWRVWLQRRRHLIVGMIMIIMFRVLSLMALGCHLCFQHPTMLLLVVVFLLSGGRVSWIIRRWWVGQTCICSEGWTQTAIRWNLLKWLVIKQIGKASRTILTVGGFTMVDLSIHPPSSVICTRIYLIL